MAVSEYGNGFHFLLALHRRYAVSLAVFITGLLLITILFRIRLLLLIPGVYVLWGGHVCYQFAKARQWRNTVIYLVATMLYAGLSYKIYTIAAR